MWAKTQNHKPPIPNMQITIHPKSNTKTPHIVLCSLEPPTAITEKHKSITNGNGNGLSLGWKKLFQAQILNIFYILNPIKY